MDSKELQKSVFKKLLSNTKTLPAYLNKISPKDFTNGLAHEVIDALQSSGQSIQTVPTKEYYEILMRERIRDKEQLSAACGMLAKMAEKPQPQDDLDMLIKELKRERMCGELTQIIKTAASRITPADIDRTYEDMMKELLRLPMTGSDNAAQGVMKEVFEDAPDRIEAYFRASNRKFPCGIKAFDKHIGGFAPGELIVLTAGTGQGKSNIQLWWANQFIKAGANVIYASLEMSYESVMDRYNAMITGLNSNDIRNKKLNPQHLARYIEGIIADKLEPAVAREFLNKARESIVDRTNPEHALKLALDYPVRKNKFFLLDIPRACSPARISREIRRLGLDTEINVVFIDYLTIMEPNFHSKDRVRELGSLAQDVKEVARSTKTIIVTAAQLNTSGMEEGDKITTDSIKYAKAIGENCDWMMGFHRTKEDFMLRQVRIELAKHRYSASATALLEVDFATMQIIDRGEYEAIDTSGASV